MSERTGYPHGTFCWVELSTPDPDAAKKFYTELFGWEYQDNEVGPGVVYTMNLKGDKNLHAMYKLDEERQKQGIPPHWLSYVSVDELEPVVEKAKAAGATAVVEPMDVMDAGRMSVIADAQGAVVGLWQPKAHIGAQIVNEHGTLSWNELMTNNVDAAGKFYTDVFGWKADTQDMGGFNYTSFSVGENPNGGMMAITEDMGPVPPNWGPYFAHDDVDAGAEKVKSLGGQIYVPPTDIPEVGRFSTIADPQGAAFSIITLKNPQ